MSISRYRSAYAGVVCSIIMIYPDNVFLDIVMFLITNVHSMSEDYSE